MTLPEKDVLNRTRGYFLDELAVLAGGRIAEEMHTKDISTGAMSDISYCTQIARAMVCRYGMSERFGFQAFNEPNAFVSSTLPPAFSEATSQAIDAEVSKLIADAYARAEELIAANREKLEKLAAKLIEKETMDGKDVEALLNPEASASAEAAPEETAP